MLENSSNRHEVPGQIFCSTLIPGCLWSIGKNEPAGKYRAAAELELALAA